MKYNSQADKAYTYLRKQLLSGRFEAGNRLAEQAVSEQAGVNRGDVRQAFARLRAEGLVVKGKRGGFFVREYSEADLQESYEVRQILEIAAARLAVERRDIEDVEQMKATGTHMLMMAKNGYYLGVCEADLIFHEQLVKASHNNRLLELYRRANIPLSGVNYLWKEREERLATLIEDAEDHFQMAVWLEERNLDQLMKLLTKTR